MPAIRGTGPAAPFELDFGALTALTRLELRGYATDGPQQHELRQMLSSGVAGSRTLAKGNALHLRVQMCRTDDGPAGHVRRRAQHAVCAPSEHIACRATVRAVSGLHAWVYCICAVRRDVAYAAAFCWLALLQSSVTRPHVAVRARRGAAIAAAAAACQLEVAAPGRRLHAHLGARHPRDQVPYPKACCDRVVHLLL